MTTSSTWAALWSRLKLWRCAGVGRAPLVAGRVWLHGGGRVLVGDRLRVDGAATPIELHAGPGAEIVIGDDVLLEGGTSIEADLSVHIGNRCVLRAFSKVMDSNFHPLHGDRKVRPSPIPVVLEAGVELGARSVVLPGARVRAGAVVRPGTVVRGPAASARAGGPPPGEPSEVRSGHEPSVATAPTPLSRLAALARSASGYAMGWWQFCGCKTSGRVFAGGRVVVENQGVVRIGRGSAFNGGMVPTRMTSHPGAELAIGERSVLNYGVTLEAFVSVRIGARCFVGSWVVVRDREGEVTAPIEIGDDVWLAHGVVVAPGVRIGDGAVVSAGSVVTRDVPPRSLAAGNPARFVGLDLVPGGGKAVPTPHSGPP
jgi:acetyltransferase-like isoleucine patch superfamily enzyme